MTNFMTKMQLRNLFLRSRQCSGHHKNDTHETPETLDTQRKNLQSIEIAGFSCIFSALRHLGRSAFQKRKMPIKNAHEFPALRPSHKFFFQQPKQPYRKRNLSAIIARGRSSRLREPFPPAHRLTITRPPQRAHSTRSPLRRGLCASELQISEKGVTLWDLSTQHWAPPAA